MNEILQDKEIDITPEGEEFARALVQMVDEVIEGGGSLEDVKEWLAEFVAKLDEASDEECQEEEAETAEIEIEESMIKAEDEKEAKALKYWLSRPVNKKKIAHTGSQAKILEIFRKDQKDRKAKHSQYLKDADTLKKTHSEKTESKAQQLVSKLIG